MVNEINGLGANTKTPGAYGALAAQRVQDAAGKDPLGVSSSNIRYTPKDAPRINDIFGYAQQDLKGLDANKDGFLDKSELTKAFGSEKAANNFMGIVDQNKDGKIDVPENAGYLAMQQNASTNLPAAMREMAGGDKEANAAIDAQAKANPAPASPEPGLITPSDRKWTDFAVNNTPALAGQVVKQSMEQLNLREKYAAFTKEQTASNTPTPSTGTAPTTAPATEKKPDPPPATATDKK
ncbi:MAG: EF-hand domain-containing protein [Cyanobacteria bacterium]|nr:EF-hand domain-containing protein [Cyanobacteriota bacterium]